MPINVYCGVMGSGKSYEVVTNVIIPAIRKGRRVVTNIDGINEERIHEYCLNKFKDDLSKLGTIVHCTDKDIIDKQPEGDRLRDDFFPYDLAMGDATSFVKGGDLVVIDEAVRYWGTRCKMTKAHTLFFTEHRHFAHPVTKVTCDLVIMIQAISMLHRVIKDITELSFETKKLKTLGAAKTYRLLMWETAKQNPRAVNKTEVRRYSKEIFPLYQSYSGGVGQEVQVDKRQNLLTPQRIAIFAIPILLLPFFGYWGVSKFFRQSPPPASASAPVASSGAALAGPGAVSPAMTASMSTVAPVVPRSPVVPFSDEWRLAGVLTVGSDRQVVIVNTSGRLRYESPSQFTWEAGKPVLGTIDGKRVTAYSGSLPGQGGGGLFGSVPSIMAPSPPPPALPPARAIEARG